jgi:hypothetical protein
MNEDYGGMLEPVLLPATMCEQAHARLDLENARFVSSVRAQQKSATRPVVSRERLRVAAPESGVRDEGL